LCRAERSQLELTKQLGQIVAYQESGSICRCALSTGSGSWHIEEPHGGRRNLAAGADASDGRPLSTLQRDTLLVYALTLSADGRLLAVDI
jgi:hypothetical protein